MSLAADRAPGIRNFFDENGFYLAENVYAEESVQSLEIEFDRIVDQLEQSGEQINARWESDKTDELDGGESRIIHTHNVHRYSAVWLEALQQQRFLDVVEQIIGPDVILHHTKLFQKPPEEGAPFPMHQDWSYFPTHLDTMIAGIIFLSDADAESGGLCVFPGSHKLGRVENSAGRELTQKENPAGSTASDILAEYSLEKAQPVNAKRGDVFFFSYLTLHGSTPNRSQRSRKTVLAQLHSGKDYLVSQQGPSHVNEQLVLRGWNHYMTRNKAGT